MFIFPRALDKTERKFCYKTDIRFFLLFRLDFHNNIFEFVQIYVVQVQFKNRCRYLLNKVEVSYSFHSNEYFFS